MNPKVSIITVTYNCGEILEGTLKSIFEQSAKIYELIIIDGGSTDSTISIIKKYENLITHWISEPDQGIYDAMNKLFVIFKCRRFIP
jgi:glycosyltransferase involved in cell wall biosynthesis